MSISHEELEAIDTLILDRKLQQFAVLHRPRCELSHLQRGRHDEPCKIGVWFEEAFKELTAKPMYKGLIVISEGPCGGDGFFKHFRKKQNIIGVVASFEFGSAKSFRFGPLDGRGRITTGIYVNQVDLLLRPDC